MKRLNIGAKVSNASKDELLSWFYGEDHKADSRRHLGNIQIHRSSTGVGTSYTYRYSIDGKEKSKTFFVERGGDSSNVKAKILRLEAQVIDYRSGRGYVEIDDGKKLKRYTLEEITRWFIRASLLDKLSPATLATYEHTMRRFIAWIGGNDTKVETVTQQTLYDYKDYLAEHGWIDRSIKSEFTRMGTVFNKAHFRKEILENPFDGFRISKVSKAKPRPTLTITEMWQALDFIKNKKTRLAWYISLYTGLRGADILRIKIEDIDFENHRISLYMAKRKNDEWITIPVHSDLIKLLEPFKEKNGHLINYKIKTARNKIGFEFGRAIKRLKGKNFYWSGVHTMRHSWSRFLASQGVKWQDTQILLGHKLPGLTTYFHDEDLYAYYKKIIEQVDFRKFRPVEKNQNNT